MKPLEPNNYTGSNPTACKYKVVERVQTSTTNAKILVYPSKRNVN
jgi:hypothetical protein